MVARASQVLATASHHSPWPPHIGHLALYYDPLDPMIGVDKTGRKSKEASAVVTRLKEEDRRLERGGDWFEKLGGEGLRCGDA